MDFEKWFMERTSRFERWLVYAAAGCLTLVIISQIMLTRPGFRRSMSFTGRLEGVPYAAEEPQLPAAALYEAGILPRRDTALSGKSGQSLELTITGGTNQADLHVRVNGETVAAFGRQRTVEVWVRDGDLVEIDGNGVNEIIELEVSAVSEGIADPAPGHKVVYFGRPETVSWVVLN